MKKIVIGLMFLLLMPIVLAQQGHMKLLAAQEINGTYFGNTADLYFELRPGSGRVFLETFPLTKMDTQISTRSAKAIACNYFDLDCEKYDFIYTIKSKTNIIGGPSAGSAIAALTTIVMQGLEINEQVVVSGTINSGGIIGPVGALKGKIKAAADENMSIVLIPTGTRFYKDKDNLTLDLKDYGKNFGVTVIEIVDLNELVFFLTGEKLRKENFTLVENKEYLDIMKFLHELLCNRSLELKELVGDDLTEEEREEIENRTLKADQAKAEEKYYSGASYCFGLNAELRRLYYEGEDLSLKEKNKIAIEIEREIQEFEKNIKQRELKTITDLQTYSVVMERLNEARGKLKDFEESESEADLAFAKERLFSAHTWAEYFRMSGKEFHIDDEALEKSCLEKIQEARERYQYVNLFLSEESLVSHGIKKAEEVYREGDYVLCLIKASQAKAEADAILSTMGVDEKNLGELLNNKLNAVSGSLARTIDKGAFPILGYSYYQYAQSLSNNPLVALVYAEYALELGNLDIYFEEKEPEESKFQINKEQIIFIWGLGLGLVTGALVVFLIRKKRIIKTPRTTRKRSGGKKR